MPTPSHARIMNGMTTAMTRFDPKKGRFSNTAPRFPLWVLRIPSRNRHFGRFSITDACTRTPAPARTQIPPEAIPENTNFLFFSLAVFFHRRALRALVGWWGGGACPVPFPLVLLSVCSSWGFWVPWSLSLVRCRPAPPLWHPIARLTSFVLLQAPARQIAL
jgi:hypothetical protein